MTPCIFVNYPHPITFDRKKTEANASAWYDIIKRCCELVYLPLVVGWMGIAKDKLFSIKIPYLPRRMTGTVAGRGGGSPPLHSRCRVQNIFDKYPIAGSWIVHKNMGHGADQFSCCGAR